MIFMIYRTKEAKTLAAEKEKVNQGLNQLCFCPEANSKFLFKESFVHLRLQSEPSAPVK